MVMNLIFKEKLLMTNFVVCLQSVNVFGSILKSTEKRDSDSRVIIVKNKIRGSYICPLRKYRRALLSTDSVSLISVIHGYSVISYLSILGGAY